jgi:hypothetical protein
MVAQGIVFRDTSNFLKPENLVICPIPSAEVPSERDRELQAGNLYWRLLVSEQCLHANYSNSIAVRRAYTPERSEPIPACTVVMLIMIYSQAFIVIGEVELTKKPPENFLLLVVKEDVGSSSDTGVGEAGCPRQGRWRDRRVPLIVARVGES